MRIKLSLLPNTLTMFNLLFGFLAVMKAIEGDIIASGWFIIIAAIFDGLDGKVARLVNKGSKFGMEFDSLSDIVSFGLAPAVLAHQAFFHRLDLIGDIVCFLYLLFGGLRLARYNINSAKATKKYFTGLPIPVAAITITSFIHFNLALWDDLLLENFFPLLIGVLCFLMISGIQYEQLPRLSFKSGRVNNGKLTILVLGLVACAIWPAELFFPLCISYIGFWGVRSAIRSIKKASREPQPEKRDY